MSSEDKLRDLRVEFLADAASNFDEYVGWGTSPIERLIIGALCTRGWGYPRHDVYTRWSDFVSAATLGVRSGKRRRPIDRVLSDAYGGVVCGIQQPVGLGDRQCVIDLLFLDIINPPGKCAVLAVELDGHDFHERTKMQAQRDKSRDRAIVAKGWHVSRFTGSEIYRDPHSCLVEIDGLMHRLAVLRGGG